MSLCCNMHNLSRMRTFYQFPVDPVQDIVYGDVRHVKHFNPDGVEEHGDLKSVGRWVCCSAV